jgi:Protein of unknown function (DUF2800)
VAHSFIVGGSTAGRLLACPGSYQANLEIPPSAQVESVYAAEGTAMHDIMAKLMRWRAQQQPRYLCVTADMVLQFALGLVNAGELEFEHYNDMIEPALRQLERLEEIYGGSFKVLGVEQPVKFPGIPAAFGTVDLIIQSADYVVHVDWKFGQGIGVKAVYSDGQGDTINPQLMYYAVAGYRSAQKRYAYRKVVVAIIQPRAAPETALTHTVVSRTEIKFFIEDLHNAVALALNRDPPRSKGEHCRFAPCKATCPLWTGPLLDLAALQPVERQSVPVKPETPTAYGNYLASAKALVDQMALFKISLDEQLHAYLQEGGLVPGWRLKAKTKMRQWVDPKLVDQELRALGFADNEIWQDKLQTFASADATARRLGVKIPEHLRVAPSSNETTIAPTSDPADVVQPVLLLEQFQNSLMALKKTPTWIQPRLVKEK